MESQLIDNINDKAPASSGASFIQANTSAVTIEALANDCIIPVFAKDNDPTISHVDFIETVHSAVKQFWPSDIVSKPSIRVSHPIKGRIPEAKYKLSKELLPHEETLYYERMMFCVEVPTICKDFDGETLSLTVGGVRAYNIENLYSRKSPEKLKLFVGFKNKVCCNLCVWSDGGVVDIKVQTIDELAQRVDGMLAGFDPRHWIQRFESWRNTWFTESQFAEFIGRCKMYLHMPAEEKVQKPRFHFGDYQLTQMVEGFYNDKTFGRNDLGRINQWNLFNLMTGANKSSYIDKFLDRAIHASEVANNISDYIK